MVAVAITGARLTGIASAVPERSIGVEELSQRFGESEAAKLSQQTGVVRRHVATGGMCASDLCFAAAERLLAQLDWPRDSIDGLVFVSQTPDHLLPATSTILHARLGLSKQCAAFDVNLGCSGWVYGLWLASQMAACGGLNRVLLLVGDTISRIASPLDRSTSALFGDAGSAAALQRDASAPPMSFVLGSHGEGAQHLIVPAGGFRNPRSETSCVRSARENGNVRSDEDLLMNGAEVFTFTLREVPAMLNAVLAAAGWNAADVDAFVFHQANRFMLDYLVKKMKLPAEKMAYSLHDYGNTSSASIPLTITTALGRRLGNTSMKLVLAGFGVGWSWGAVAMECGPLELPPLASIESV